MFDQISGCRGPDKLTYKINHQIVPELSRIMTKKEVEMSFGERNILLKMKNKFKKEWVNHKCKNNIIIKTVKANFLCKSIFHPPNLSFLNKHEAGFYFHFTDEESEA